MCHIFCVYNTKMSLYCSPFTLYKAAQSIQNALEIEKNERAKRIALCHLGINTEEWNWNFEMAYFVVGVENLVWKFVEFSKASACMNFSSKEMKWWFITLVENPCLQFKLTTKSFSQIPTKPQQRICRTNLVCCSFCYSSVFVFIRYSLYNSSTLNNVLYIICYRCCS